jgi:hypothetical protein
MRYVMRIAKPVSHQNFERTLRFPWGACLLECLFIPTTTLFPRQLGSEDRDPLCGQSFDTSSVERTKMNDIF